MTTNEIVSGCGPSEFRNAIKGYYSGRYKTDPIVSAKYYNETGFEVTEDDPTVVQVTYTVETPVPLWGPTVEQIMVVPMTTNSTIDFVYPSDI
jgi:hypothetical protein